MCHDPATRRQALAACGRPDADRAADPAVALEVVIPIRLVSEHRRARDRGRAGKEGGR